MDVRLNQPPSRKVRALLAYLAMAARPVSREKLCELLWDVADDPRSELRWCLSKLRPLVDRPTTTRIVADRKQVSIEPSSLDVDRPVGRATYAEDAEQSVHQATFGRYWLCSAATFSRAFRSKGLHRSKTGSPASGTASVSCANSFSNGSAPSCRRRAMIVSKSCENASKSRRSTKRFTSNLFARCSARGLYAEAQAPDRCIGNALSDRRHRSEIARGRFRGSTTVTSKPAVVSLIDTARFDAPRAHQRRDTRGPTLLLLPFTAAPESVADADSVTSDIIFGFAKLRSFSVIARGTAFSLRSSIAGGGSRPA